MAWSFRRLARAGWWLGSFRGRRLGEVWVWKATFPLAADEGTGQRGQASPRSHRCVTFAYSDQNRHHCSLFGLRQALGGRLFGFIDP